MLYIDIYSREMYSRKGIYSCVHETHLEGKVSEFEYISISFYFMTYRKRKLQLQNENLGLNTNITDAMLLSSFKLLHICFP